MLYGDEGLNGLVGPRVQFVSLFVYLFFDVSNLQLGMKLRRGNAVPPASAKMWISQQAAMPHRVIAP